MGNLNCTFKVDYKPVIKCKDDVLKVVATLLDKVEDNHIKTFFEINRDSLPSDVNCKTVEEAKDVLSSIDDY
jgi:hypothetical protein